MHSRYLSFLPALLLVGCGGGETGPSAPTPSAPPASAAPSTTEAAATEAPAATATSGGTWDGSQGVAEVKGTVRFDGDPPVVGTLDMTSDAACHPTSAPDPAVQVNGDGMLKNVVVYVSKGHDAWTFPKPTEPAYLSQQGCMYVPHVMVVRAGQDLLIKNEDPVTHNVHSYSKRNPSFNKSQPEGAPEIHQTLKRDEKQFAIKCDIHAWMSSFVTVVDNPFFAVSAEDGTFSLGKLPPGEYQLTAEHEVYGSQKATVKVTASGADPVSFTFSS